MEPTIANGSFHFYLRPYLFAFKPKRFDVVAIRMAGYNMVLLKRIIALPGETLALQKGELFINGKKLAEPHVAFPSSWSLQTRTVAEDAVYVIGDNRSVPMAQHRFGQVELSRIIGKVIL